MTNKWEGLNRRKFPRINYPCLVVINHKDGEKDDVILTHTENVGRGGICVILKQNVKMFSLVNLELDLLDMEDHIRCQGKIVWNVRRKNDADSKPLFYDLGIEFQDLKEADEKRLIKILDHIVSVDKTSIV